MQKHFSFTIAFTSVLTLLSACSSSPAPDTSQRVANVSTAQQTSIQKPIQTLEYYPECFEVVGSISGHSGPVAKKYSSLNAQPKTNKKEAIASLKQQAKQLGADAIAIVDYKITHQSQPQRTGATIDWKRHSFFAKAIKYCDNTSAVAKARSPQNNESTSKPEHKVAKLLTEQGERFVELVGMNTKISYAITTNKAKSDKSKVISLNSKAIFLDGRIYDFTLGEKVSNLVSVFGSPSAILTISPENTVYMYGRRHIFYVHRDQVTGFSIGDWYLPLRYNNEIEFHNYLDDELHWSLAGRFELKQPIDKFIGFEGLALSAKDKNQLTTRRGNIVSQLQFSPYHNLTTDKLDKKFTNLVIYMDGYQPISWQQINKPALSSLINLGKQDSQASTILDKTSAAVVSQIGEPIVKIHKERGKETWIYNDQLSVDFLNEQSFRVIYESEKMVEQAIACSTCLYIGQATQNLPRELMIEDDEGEYKFIYSDTEYKAFSDSKDTFIEKIVARVLY